ncbi:helix-turn-helix domain-containing protein [Nocardia nova]|nr:helix-turn-helix domain-containing protein [Nocardia nova]
MSTGKAETAARRSMTAREGAERLGVSPRTIRRMVAEPRADFEARARDRRTRAAQLRNAGHSYKEIAAAMDCSTGTVGTLLRLARREGLLTKAAVVRRAG